MLKLQNDLIKQRNWDVLIILDCCRFDAFQEVVNTYPNLSGDTIEVNSEATDTQEWYELHWEPKAVHDNIIIITAHPTIYRKNHQYEKFFCGNTILKFEFELGTSWLKPLLTLGHLIDRQPHTTKRFLVHLIPPHLPYLGERGQTFLDQYKWDKSSRHLQKSVYNIATEYGRKYGWTIFWEYYIENIKVALDDISECISSITGTVVITADHGEIIGPDFYGHGEKRYPDKEIITNTERSIRRQILQSVPWHEVIK